MIGCTQLSSAQNLSYSPYSIFGPGELQFTGSASLLAKGRSSQAIRESNGINSLNPASYSALKYTSIEAGLLISSGDLSSDQITQSSANAGFAYLNVGIPVSVKKGIGLSFGLAPYTVIGYRVTTTDSALYTYDTLNNPVYMQGIGKTLKGNGGLTKFYIGSAWNVVNKPNTSASIGANFGYLFGKMQNLTQIYFPSTYYRFNTEENISDYVGGFLFDLGFQLEHKIASKTWVGIGATYTMQSELPSNREFLYRTLPFGAGSSGIRDTFFFTNKSSSVILPTSIKTGISISDKNHYQLVSDFDWNNWSSYRNGGNSDSLRNNWKFSIGGHYIPKSDSRNIFNRIEYRLGYRFEQGNVYFMGNGFNEIAYSAGLAIPMQKSLSRLNLSVEFMKRGSTQNHLVEENYIRFLIGITFSDKWFTRIKYD